MGPPLPAVPGPPTTVDGPEPPAPVIPLVLPLGGPLPGPLPVPEGADRGPVTDPTQPHSATAMNRDLEVKFFMALTGSVTLPFTSSDLDGKWLTLL